MALTDFVNQTAPVAGEATAPVVGGAKKDTKEAAFKRDGAVLRASLSEEEKAFEGSKSDTVAFVAALGNPAKNVGRTTKEGVIKAPEVVGYRLKALEDISVPVATLAADARTPYDVADQSEITVHAGETFDVTSFEAAVLVSRPEFAGSFTGDGKIATATVKYRKDSTEPKIVLRLGNAQGSIKENMIEVADSIPNPENPEKPRWQVKAEFADKFAFLYNKRAAAKKAGVSKARAAGESAKDIAAAFRNYLSKKN